MKTEHESLIVGRDTQGSAVDSDSHDCVCLHAPGHQSKTCECGIYSDARGAWCANENCRAVLGEKWLEEQGWHRNEAGEWNRFSYDDTWTTFEHALATQRRWSGGT